MLQKFIDENYKSHTEFLDKLERQLKVLQSAYPLKGTKDETIKPFLSKQVESFKIGTSYPSYFTLSIILKG